MTEAGTMHRERPGAAPARLVRVWDPLVRLIHWGVAGGVLLNATVLEDESTAHETVGYVVLGFVLVRLAWGLIGTSHARFAAFPPNPVAALRHLAGLLRGHHRVHLSHNPAGALMVYNLWATLIGLGLTGYMMGTPRFFGMEWVEELHEGLFAWLMVSVALHVAAVLLDSWLTRTPLVRAMIDGRKRIPADAGDGT
jgi:cytochrome b